MQTPPLLRHHHSFLHLPCSMSSSASCMPQPVEPPTTIQTKSSFSDIEPVQEPSLYHLTLSDPSFISSSLYTTQSLEPFTSPLTETNLNYHKSTFPSSIEVKRHYVDSFIQSQQSLLRQEQELQRKTKAEIQSLIPLDTRSFDEELILDDSQQHWADLLSSTSMTASRKRFSFSSIPASAPAPDRRGRTSLVHSWLSSIIDHNGHETTCNATIGTDEQPLSFPRINHNRGNKGNRSSKTQWLKSFTRWIRFGHGKRHRKTDQDNGGEQQQQQQQQYHHHHHHRQSPLSLATITATAIEDDRLRHDIMGELTLDDDDDCQQYDERQHKSKKPSRHVSWSMGTSFEEYKLGKSRIRKEQGFYGDTTRGGSQRRSIPPHLSLLIRNASHVGSTAEKMDDPPLPPTPTLMTTPTTATYVPLSAPASPTSTTATATTTSHRQRGMGFSFVPYSLSSTAGSLLHPRKRLTRRRERKVDHIDQQGITQASALEDSHFTDNSGDVNGMTAMDPHYFYHYHQPRDKDTHRRRYSSGHLIDRYSPKLSALKEEAGVMAAKRQHLVAFRYPRMVRRKDLRNNGDHMDYLAGEDRRYMGSKDLIYGQDLYNYTSHETSDIDNQYDGDNDILGGGYDDDDNIEEDDDNSLVKYSRQYRNSSKRFSDPGAGLSAPPFPIGRPLSSFYD